MCWNLAFSIFHLVKSSKTARNRKHCHFTFCLTLWLGSCVQFQWFLIGLFDADRPTCYSNQKLFTTFLLSENVDLNVGQRKGASQLSQPMAGICRHLFKFHQRCQRRDWRNRFQFIVQLKLTLVLLIHRMRSVNCSLTIDRAWNNWSRVHRRRKLEY